MRQQQLLVCILLLQIGIMARAQKVTDYIFTTFNTDNGLASNTVTSVIQGHKGFMWFATTNGLQRYDGKRFLTFKNKPGDTLTIPHNGVDNVYEDSKHNLWVSTVDTKLGIFNTTHFTYQEVPIRVKDPKELGSLKYPMEDKQGNLYLLLQRQAIYQYAERTKEFIRSPINDKLPKGWSVIELLIDQPSGRFWMACDSGLVLYDPIKKQVSYRGHNAHNDPVITALEKERFTRMVHIDRNGQFWCMTGHLETGEAPTLHRYNPASGAYVKQEPFPDFKTNYEEIKKIFTQKNGRTWLCGLAFLMEYNQHNPTTFDRIPVNDKCNPKSLSFEIAGDIYEDREQNLWVSTTQGIFRFNPDANFFSSYILQRVGDAAPEQHPIMSVCEMKNGEVWIGAVGAGLYTYGKNLTPMRTTGDVASRYKQRSIWSIHEHGLTGEVWMGSPRGQMAVYNPATGQSDEFSPAILAGKTVIRITEDKQGNLWMITRDNNQTGDIIKWDRQAAGNDHKKGYIAVKTFKEATPSNIIVDANNFVWVTMYNDGLYKINAATLAQADHITTTKPEGYRLTENGQSDIMEYNDSLMIIAANTLHILHTKTGKISVIGKTAGLPGGVISVQKDTAGILWLGLNEGGLCRFNMGRNIFTVYNKRDGILDEFLLPAARFTMRDGRLLFFGERSFMTFQPAAMVMNTPAPPAVIADFKLGNISLPIDSLLQLFRITLPYDKNSVTIEFSALSYKSQTKINYYYKMEGLDDDWIPADEALRAMYNYLPPGGYTFLVKTDNGMGLDNNITRLSIKVEAPFWRTWWFYFILVLLAVGIFFLVDRERIKRLVSLQKIRTEVALNLHQEVSATLSSINMLGEMAHLKADKDLERSKEYIQQIRDKSNYMVNAMGDILWSLDPGNDSMEKSLLRMREYIDSLMTRHDAHIDLTVDSKVTAINLDMKKRLEFFILFKESLRAIVQYAEGRETVINIGLSGNKWLQLTMQDATANPAINTPEGEKLIRDLQQRATFIHADIEIQRDRNGLDIILLMPME